MGRDKKSSDELIHTYMETGLRGRDVNNGRAGAVCLLQTRCIMVRLLTLVNTLHPLRMNPGRHYNMKGYIVSYEPRLFEAQIMQKHTTTFAIILPSKT